MITKKYILCKYYIASKMFLNIKKIFSAFYGSWFMNLEKECFEQTVQGLVQHQIIQGSLSGRKWVKSGSVLCQDSSDACSQNLLWTSKSIHLLQALYVVLANPANFLLFSNDCQMHSPLSLQLHFFYHTVIFLMASKIDYNINHEFH